MILGVEQLSLNVNESLPADIPVHLLAIIRTIALAVDLFRKNDMTDDRIDGIIMLEIQNAATFYQVGYIVALYRHLLRARIDVFRGTNPVYDHTHTIHL